VQTEFGSHLLLVRERPTTSFEQAAGTLDGLRSEVLADQLDDLLFRVACEPDVVQINARYGSWDRSLCDSRGSLPSVLPPRGTPAADADADADAEG
jgi:hypothetical protein